MRDDISARGSCQVAARPTSDEAVLDVQNLTVAFPRYGQETAVVSGVSFQLRRGRALAIVGESGSGKTVTVRSLFRLLPSAARIRADRADFDGVDLLGLDQAAMTDLRGRRMGMVFQNAQSAFNPTLKIGRQLTEPLTLHGLCPRSEAKRRAADALDRVGIREPRRMLSMYPFQLSGGMLQRAMIAMATITEPALLIADEPTTAVDVTLQRQILALLAKQRDAGMSVVLITHDLGVARAFCDDLVVMYAGEVMETGAVADVLAAPRHPYTAGLVASTLELGQRGKLRSIPGNPVEPGRKPSGCPFHTRCRSADASRCLQEQDLLPSDIGLTACWRGVAQ